VTILFSDGTHVGPDDRDGSIRSFIVRGDWIVWVGARPVARARRRVSLAGLVVTPGFVDAHVHLTATGLTMAGLDLSGVSGADGLARRLRDHVRKRPERFVWGGGWDDTTWPAPPRAALVDAVAAGRFVYLPRVDAHSALLSSGLLDAAGCARLEGADRDAGGRPTGIVRRDAHHAARKYFMDNVPAAALAEAHRLAAARAASVGITCVHEMTGPYHGAGERDLGLLLGGRLPVRVVVYYATDDVGAVIRRGLPRIGGDLNVDGALGSRTAALAAPYADVRGHRGHLYRDSSELADLFEASTRAGLQAGVHCIGEAACEAAVRGLERAARRVGVGAVRRMRHRLEHFEMSSKELIARAARVGAGLSLQPAFDAAWGGESGMYSKRVGRARARTMNDFRAMARSGAPLGFGSDSPVTPLDPIGAVRAAMRPRVASHAMTPAQALRAATVGAAGLARQEGTLGRVAAGYRADFVVWSANPLADDSARILATVVGGRVVYGDIG
jgi:hypothetical protein